MLLKNEQLEILSIPIPLIMHDCNKCGTDLIAGENWLESNQIKHDYICTPCQHERHAIWRGPDGRRLGTYVSSESKRTGLTRREVLDRDKHLFYRRDGSVKEYKPERKVPEFHYPEEHERRLRNNGKTQETAIRAKREGHKDGFMYALWHPRSPEFIKVGRAYDPISRLSDYNVGCPDALYEMPYVSEYFKNNIVAEASVHTSLKKDGLHHRGEWFKLDLDTAIKYIKHYVEPI
jgi:hypothetical protein|tara:strand:+ start:26 stop:727 length:702 start_codon:yes stop_codon:yes gene_type:complete